MTHPLPPRALWAGVAATLLLPTMSLAQQVRPDTFSLAALHVRAEQRDPRAAQAAVLQQQSSLRMTTIDNERLHPQVSVTSVAQHLSDVARVPIPNAKGPAQDQFDLYATVRQPLVDFTRAPRAALERAQATEAQSALRASLWQQRYAVNDAFFGVLFRRAQIRTIDAGLTDLRERRRAAAERVAAGAALPSDVMVLDAELLRREQSRDEAVAEEAAARSVLASLTGDTVRASTVLPLPATDTVLPEPATQRPELAQFSDTKATLTARRDVIAAQTRPRLALTGRTGYGRPGLNQLGRTFDTYYVAGVQVEWTPWTWGATARDREVQRLQEQVVATQEASLSAGIARAAEADRIRIAALARNLDVDAAVIAMRTKVLAETRARVDAGDITMTDYIARQTELLTAQLDRETRLIRLAEARARYLTTIGLEVR